MTHYKLTSLISILIFIPLLSACGADGMATPSGVLAAPSAESRLGVGEATSIPTAPPVPTNTSVPPTPVPTEPPVPTDTPVPPTPVPTESPVPTDTPVPPTPVPTETPVPTDTPVPPTPVAVLPPPTLLYFWAQW